VQDREHYVGTEGSPVVDPLDTAFELKWAAARGSGGHDAVQDREHYVGTEGSPVVDPLDTAFERKWASQVQQAVVDSGDIEVELKSSAEKGGDAQDLVEDPLDVEFELGGVSGKNEFQTKKDLAVEIKELKQTLALRQQALMTMAKKERKREAKTVTMLNDRLRVLTNEYREDRKRAETP